jgi:hypothetical protein
MAAFHAPEGNNLGFIKALSTKQSDKLLNHRNDAPERLFLPLLVTLFPSSSTVTHSAHDKFSHFPAKKKEEKFLTNFTQPRTK